MANMNAPSFDVAILGAGPVGQALALLLAQRAADPGRILLIKRPPGSRQDPRVLAMNYGSETLLRALDAWPDRHADIERIHVSQRGRLGRCVIDHTDFDVPRLGSVVPYAELNSRFEQAVERAGIRVQTGHGATLTARHGDHAVITLEGVKIDCAVAVQCDGSNTPDIQRDYRQHAVLTTVRAERPQPAMAWERFTSDGPLALLPHPDGPDHLSVVWCHRPEQARALAGLDDADFSRALTAAFGARLGTLRCAATRHVMPLNLSLRRAQIEGRSAIIGNAAQTLHPVAGQGLNLGLRDAAGLARALSRWQDGLEDAPQALRAFAQARQADRWITAGLTDLMPRVFAAGVPLLEHACGAALLALDMLPALRRPLARQLLYGLRA